MSKFWATTQSSDSESESDHGSDYETKNKAKMGGRYDMFDESSDSDTGGARVVRSQADRTWDSLRDSIKKIRNATKNNDWPLIQDEFEALNKKVDKSKLLIVQSGGVPKFYVKILAEVEDQLAETLKDKDALKKLKPNVVKAVNQMKLKVRKHNETYKAEISDYRENPSAYESGGDRDSSDDESSDDDSSDDDSSDDDSSSDDSSDDDDSSDSDAPKKRITRKLSDSEDSDDDSDSEDHVDDPVEGDIKLTGRLKWMKIEYLIKLMPHLEKTLRKKNIAEKKKRIRSQHGPAAADGDDANDYVASVPSSTTNTTSTWVLDNNVTLDMLVNKLKEIIGMRGRKKTNLKESIRALEVLAKASRLHGPRIEIPVLMHLISAMFDSQKVFDEYMELHDWRTSYRHMMRIMTILKSHPALVIGTLDDTVTDGASIGDETGPIKVVGTLENVLARLSEEYTKSLQQINPHTQEYVTRLSDEASLMELSEHVFAYYVRAGDLEVAANAALLHAEHIYYKHDSMAAAVKSAHLFNKTWGLRKDLHPAALGNMSSVKVSGSNDSSKIHPASYRGTATVSTPVYNAEVKLEELSLFIFKHGDDRSRARALLCCVQHHAIHDRFYRARDMFLISHIQDNIEKADVKTQILFNRALVTLGLCAFRVGLIQKAYDSLYNICTGRLKELLAQGHGSKWGQEKDPDQEKAERRRQLPYHMHINPDLLECCHLISAMFLELPHLARAPGNQHVVSRHFRKYFNGYSRLVFTGPPENTREHILAAAKSLINGDWKKALDLVTNLEAWNLLPGDGATKVVEMLRKKIKEEGIRIYLLTYGSHFESLSLHHICEMFDMEPTVARRILSQMIFNKEISAAWEHPADMLVLYKVDPSPIQTLSQNLADKVNALMESNERLLDPFVNGIYGHNDDYSGRGRVRDNDDRQQGRRPFRIGAVRTFQPRVVAKIGGRPRHQGGRGQGESAWAGRQHNFSERGAGPRSQGRGGGRGRGAEGRGRGPRRYERNDEVNKFAVQN